MKKFFMCLVLCLLFVFVGCGSNSEDPINGDDTDSTDSQNNDENADTDKTDSDNTDSDKTDSDNTDTDNTDSDKTDSDKTDSDNTDTDNTDSDKTDSDNTDTDNTDTDKTDSDNTDSDNTDTDNTDTDKTDTDNPDTENPDTDNPDTGSEIECTGISIYAFIPYYEGNYYGAVSSISGESSYDMIYLEFYNGIAVDYSYDLSSEANSNYQTCTECLRVNEEIENGKMFFQESGTLAVSAYDPETFELNATVTAKLVETTFASNGHSTPKEGGACIEIEAGPIEASDPSTETATCADIMDCFDTCPENDNDCKSECISSSTAVARTQFVNLQKCSNEHNCDTYRCQWTNCRAEGDICGMAVNEEYNIPYGTITINGSFPYLYGDPKPVTVDPETGVATETELPEDETKITIDNDHVLMGAFATGAFGNNNTDIIADEEKVFSYAQISHFSDSLITNNITLVQTYQGSDKKTPTVHLVTTATEPAELTLGLGEWTTEARIFVKGTKSDGTSCDHAFGVGTVNISAIGWTVGATTITVTGEAELYSYRATPDYGGDISGDYWVACDAE